MTGSASAPAERPPPDRPLVTFALFAYNQERYIREAVAGAFAQTYEPLEIVLSDDGSSDRSFEIMQEMADAYDGPHEVRVVRNERNLGVVPHVLARGREARGEIVVLAAGDDVSKPERTARAVAPFLGRPEVFAAVSLVDIVDERGEVLAEGAVRPLHLGKPSIYIKAAPGVNEVVQGCAAAYRREIFHLPLPEGPLDFPEDLLFSFYIAITGREIARIDAALVQYRAHAGALSNRAAGGRTPKKVEERLLRGAHMNMNMIRTFEFLAEAEGNAGIVDRKAMARDLERSRIIATWPDRKFPEKVSAAGRALLSFDLWIVKWVVATGLANTPFHRPKAPVSR